jgi:hypothetical protein
MPVAKHKHAISPPDTSMSDQSNLNLPVRKKDFRGLHQPVKILRNLF